MAAKKSKKTTKKPTAKQLAARKKFVAAVKAGKFRKGANKVGNPRKGTRQHPEWTVTFGPRYGSVQALRVKAATATDAIRKAKQIVGDKAYDAAAVFEAHQSEKSYGMIGRTKRKRNKTIIKAKRVTILNLTKKKNPPRKPNITSASDLAYAGTAKRATQDGVKGWTLGGKFFPGSATTKAVKVTASAYLDLRTGDVWKRKAKGNPAWRAFEIGERNGVFFIVWQRHGVAAKGEPRIVKKTTTYKTEKLRDRALFGSSRKAKGNPKRRKEGDVWVETYSTSAGRKYRVLRAEYDGDSLGTAYADFIADKKQADWEARMLRKKKPATKGRKQMAKRNIEMMAGGEYPMRASWDYDPVRAGETRASRADYFSRPHVIGGKKISGAKLKQMVEKRQRQAVARAEERLKKARASKDVERIDKAKTYLSETREKVRGAKVTSGKRKGDEVTAAKREQSRAMTAATKARKATTSRLASRSLQRSVPLKKVRKNPSVEQKLHEWRGHPKKRDAVLNAPDDAPSPLYQLGPLQDLKVEGYGPKDFRIEKPGAIWVCADTRGKIYFATKSTAPMTDLPAGPIGKVRRIVYGPVHKKQFYNKSQEFFHDFGEDNGKRPTLHSDGKGGLLLRGGDYRITYRGIEN